jgi:hypothetical protein
VNWDRKRDTKYGDIPRRRKRLSFDIPDLNLDRIHEIDVLWYKNRTIYYEFEVEHTTDITDAIVRGSNITTSVKRFILIPEERENLLFNKLREPVIDERTKKDNWMFIWYGDFENFYVRNQRKTKINASDIEKLNRMPQYSRIDPLEKYM